MIQVVIETWMGFDCSWVDIKAMKYHGHQLTICMGDVMALWIEHQTLCVLVRDSGSPIEVERDCPFVVQ